MLNSKVASICKTLSAHAFVLGVHASGRIGSCLEQDLVCICAYVQTLGCHELQQVFALSARHLQQHMNIDWSPYRVCDLMIMTQCGVMLNDML